MSSAAQSGPLARTFGFAGGGFVDGVDEVVGGDDDHAVAVADELGITVRTLHLPRCLLAEHADRAHDRAADRVMVVTPDDVFELSGSKLTPQVHVPACDGRPDRLGCRGLRPDYLERFGDAEVAAARGLASMVAPTRLPVAR